jgi:cytochrome P450
MSLANTNCDAVISPMPPMACDQIGGFSFLSTLRTNAFCAFPPRCLEEPVIRLSAAGKALIIACSPEAFRHVLLNHEQDYRRPPIGRRALGAIFGRGLAVSEGEEWRRQRQTVSPAFTPRTLPILSKQIMRCAAQACSRLEQSNGAEVDLLGEMQKLSLEIAVTTMFSLEVETFGVELRAMVSEFMRTIGRPYPSDFLLPDVVPTPVRIRRALFRRRWIRLIRSIIKTRRDTGRAETARDLFDMLTEAYGPDQDELVTDQVSTMIVAGHETTALALFWTCTLLAKAPDWQSALAAETCGMDLSVEAAATALPKLTVTRAIVQEALRLYPPLFMSARQAVRPQDICGIHVQKGAIVFMPFWLLHRNPRWWSAPGTFDPRRFLDGVESDRFAYLPFGAGPHVCLGATLAMTEAILVIARLAREWIISIANDRPILPVGRVTTQPDHTPAFVLRRRPPVGSIASARQF